MNAFFLNLFEGFQRFLKFAEIVLNLLDIHRLYDREFRRGFEQNKHKGMV
jgi:hypothetical protein